MNILMAAVEMCEALEAANSQSEIILNLTARDWADLKKLMPQFHERLENSNNFGLKIGDRTVNFVRDEP